MGLHKRPPDVDDAPITVFRRCDALAAGWTDEQLYACFVRVIHGVYTTPTSPLNHRLKCAATALTVPEGTVITGRSAATLRGVQLADFGSPVEVDRAGQGRDDAAEGVAVFFGSGGSS